MSYHVYQTVVTQQRVVINLVLSVCFGLFVRAKHLAHMMSGEEQEVKDGEDMFRKIKDISGAGAEGGSWSRPHFCRGHVFALHLARCNGKCAGAN